MRSEQSPRLATDLPRLLLGLVDELRHQPQRMLREGGLARRGQERLLSALGLTADRGWAEEHAAAFLSWLLALARTLGLLAEREAELEVQPVAASSFFHGSPADRCRLLLMAWLRMAEPQLSPGATLGPGPTPAPTSSPSPSPSPVTTAKTAPATGEPAATAALPEDAPAPDLSGQAAGVAAAAGALPGAEPPRLPSFVPGPGAATKRKLLRQLARQHRQGPLAAVAFAEELKRSPERGAAPPVALSLELLAQLVLLGICEAQPWEEQGAIVVSAAGAFALGTGVRPPRPAAQPGHLIVQPTFTIVVVAEQEDLGLFYEVGRFARPTGPPPTFSYLLAARSALRAAREGLSLDEVHDLLRRASPHPLPQNVVHSLGQWQAAQSRLRLRRGVTLVELSDPAELEELLPFAELSPGVRRISPTLLLLPVRERSEVVQVLGTRDFVDIDYQAPLPPCLELGPELELRPLASCTNLWTPLLLARYATAADAQGVVRLDPQHVRRAIAAGGEAAAEAVRRELQNALVGGLPAELELVLWSATGKLGTLHLVHAPVLCASAAAELDALLRVPAVHAALVRRLGPEAALLRQDSSPRLLAVLQALGLTVRSDHPTPEGAEAAEDQPISDPSQILQLLREAASRGEELVLTYDPGARRPLEEVRIVARELTSRKGRHYLHALRPGQTEERVFALSYVTGVRRVARRG